MSKEVKPTKTTEQSKPAVVKSKSKPVSKQTVPAKGSNSKTAKNNSKNNSKSSSKSSSSSSHGWKYMLLAIVPFAIGFLSSPQLSALLLPVLKPFTENEPLQTSSQKQTQPRDGVESLPPALHDEFFHVKNSRQRRRREGQLDEEYEEEKKLGLEDEYEEDAWSDDDEDEEWSDDDYDYDDEEEDEEAIRRMYKTGTKQDEALLDSPFWDEHLSFVVHMNGEAEPCASGGAGIKLARTIRSEIELHETSLEDYTKFDLDALLTSVIADVLEENECGPPRTTSSFNSKELAFLTHCDRGPDHTPILHDHDYLVPVEGLVDRYYPCHFHTREGLRITSFHQFATMVQTAISKSKQRKCSAEEKEEEGEQECRAASSIAELHLYAVPAGRHFMFAPSYIGETFDLHHVDLPRMNNNNNNNNNDHHPPLVQLKVLSVTPRVFDVINFFSKEESDEVVHVALAETSESHRMKRSSTGASGYNLNSKRTSENAFVTHNAIASKIKRRCFDVLGLDTYVENMADGLQVLRYNKTAAYVDHLDYIEDYKKRQEHDYDSHHVGTNRYATILLYMSDLPEDGGGETVFVKSEKRGDFQTALHELRNSPYGNLFKKGSWEEKLTTQCKTRMSVKPRSARAVLFYSQHADGSCDYDSLHGGCPVLRGEKMAANLWVWNGPRAGYQESPKNAWVEEKKQQEQQQRKTTTTQKSPPQPKGSVSASFRNSGKEDKYKNAKLYYEDQYWGELGSEDPPLNVNTFRTHRWFVKVDGKDVAKWVIDDRAEQIYTL